jgi:Lar family restriction alleviation protein
MSQVDYNEEGLSPCPFCGGNARLHLSADGHGVEYEDSWMVICSGCPCQLDPQADREEAAALWNKRPRTRAKNATRTDSFGAGDGCENSTSEKGE